jgi:hypothetical protein
MSMSAVVVVLLDTKANVFTVQLTLINYPKHLVISKRVQLMVQNQFQIKKLMTQCAVLKCLTLVSFYCRSCKL